MKKFSQRNELMVQGYVVVLDIEVNLSLSQPHITSYLGHRDAFFIIKTSTIN